MRALVIWHDAAASPGLLGDRLEARGFELARFVVVEDVSRPVYRGDFPDPLDHDLVLAMGAPWSVYDTATIGSWIGTELELLRRAHANGVPVMGVCFGGQALAAALGGRVERAPRIQLGWFPVHPTREGAVGPGPWAEWHSDRFLAPPGSRLEAEDDLCQQAFTIGRSLGVQFHPEMTPTHVEQWLELGGAQAERELARAGTTPERLMTETRANLARATRNASDLVDWFLDSVAFPGFGHEVVASPAGPP